MHIASKINGIKMCWQRFFVVSKENLLIASLELTLLLLKIQDRPGRFFNFAAVIVFFTYFK